MKLDELEKMAQQTAAYGVHPSGEYIYSFYTEQLQAFARLVASAERERFADECIDLVASYGGPVDLEAAIRARGSRSE